MKVRLFTKENCAPCRAMKALLAKHNAEIEEVSIDEPDGLALASFHDVVSTPTVQVLDERGFCVKRCHSLDEVREVVK